MTYSNEGVVEFYRLLGLTDEDKIVIGKKWYRKPINTIRDIPKFCGQDDMYITPNPMTIWKLKENTLRYVCCYSDLDFKNYEWAMCEADNVKAIMEDFGFFYGLVCSGRGLQLYVPVNINDLSMGSELNRVLNQSILRDYYLTRIIDRGLITNYSTFLRLPNTINSKNGELATIICHNLDPSIDYWRHNYEILLGEYQNFLNSVPKPLAKEPATTKFDFDNGSFRSELIERMVALDPILIHEIRAKQKDRELNGCVYPNLAAYTAGKAKKIEGAYEFVRQIEGDPRNLKRWLDKMEEYCETGDEKKKLIFNAKALLNWADRYFGREHPVTKLAQNDFIRLKFHNGYYKFIEEQPMHDSVELMRKEMNRFLDEEKNVPGFHWIIGETGLGKTEMFNRLIRSGLKVVTLVPYLMLQFNLKRESVYTYDSIGFGHKMRLSLMKDLLHADVIVVDEVHCLKTFRSISEEKAKMLDLLEETLEHLVKKEKKPVFLLTSTPSVEQISTIQDPGASKFIGFLEKEQKRISIHIIDKFSLEKAVKRHSKVLVFIDDKKEVGETRRFLQSIGVKRPIFTVTKNEQPQEKHEIEQQLKTLDKYVIIGTSSVSSGINIPLDTIIFTNRIMNQQTVYQAMGRLRIINKLNEVHPIYVLKQPMFRIPNWAESMDLFEFVAPSVLITYLSKLYKIIDIQDKSRSKVISFNRLNRTAEIVALIKGTGSLSEFYDLPEIQTKKLYLIPVEVMNELGRSGWLDKEGWANIPFSEITKINSDEVRTHGAKVKVRNPEIGYGKPVWHYFDPSELCRIIDQHPNRAQFIKKLPKKVGKIISEITNNDLDSADHRKIDDDHKAA